ncbi:Protein transport protein S9 plasma membrane t-SNARE [Linnemannia zychae]|nr:Protein transport protein S9 plasma membrane t-SNARE [Linnemannia zychae]
MATYGANNNGGNYGSNSYGANSYGANRPNNSYGNNSYNSQSNGGSYNSAPRPGQYGQQNQQYGSNGNQYGSNGQQYSSNGNQYGSNGQQYGSNGNQYGGNNYQYGSSGNQYGQYGNQQNNYGGYGDRYAPQPGQETEEDVNRVAQEIRDTRQESVNSTRNALRALQEAEESSGRTMVQLSDQSEQLGRIERSLDSAQIHADNAQQKAGELKTVNRSMFAIHIKNPFNSTKKRERELEEAKRKAAEELAQREAIRREEYQSKQRVDAAMGTGAYARHPGLNNNNNNNGYSNNGRGGPGERSAYSFENTAEDDAQEDEIDRNLDAMSGYLSRLKTNALTMNQEVNRQNERMTNITSKTDNLHGSVTHNTALLNRIAKKG